jgi:hypothetical protein
VNKLFLFYLIFLASWHLQAEPLLDRMVDLGFKQTPVHEALAQLSSAGSFDLAYNTRIIPSGLKVTLVARALTVRETLYKILGTGYTFKEKGNSLVIKKSKSDQNELIGYIKDPITGQRIAGASVYDQRTLRATTTDQNGFYKLKTSGPSTVVVSRLAYRDTIFQVNSMSPRFIELDLASLTVDTTFFQPNTDLNFQLLRAEYRVRKFFAAQLDRYHCLNLGSNQLRRTFQVSLVPRIGSNHTLDAQVSNLLSINLLAGQSKEVRALEIGGIGNFTEKRVIGVQLGGMFNINHGNTQGWQEGGLLSTTNQTLSGVQINGLLSVADTTKLRAIQISGIASVVKTGKMALQVSGWYSQADEVNGLQMSAIVNHSSHIRGLQIGLFNSAKTCECVQIGLINRVGKRWLPLFNMGRMRKGG